MANAIYNTIPPLSNTSANAGLCFNKFCNEWKNWSLRAETGDETNPKLDWINRFVNTRQGNKQQLEALHNRRSKLLKSLDLQAIYFKTQGVFVTGMGNPHPVENGFTWHHTLGVPYLTGSSIKGITKAWCEQWLDDEDFENEDQQTACKRIFGSYKESKDNNTGSVIFHDAIPISPVQLKAEVMTPHYSEYYQSTGNISPPGDWLSPTPIPFLAVDKNQMLHFVITARNQGNKQDAEKCINWLSDALQYIGAGAKTASGYGYFSIYTLAMKWIEETIESICSENKIPDDKKQHVIFENSLAQKWQQIEDKEQQRKVFNEIKKQWIDKNIWEEEKLTGSRKKARKVYAEYEAKFRSGYEAPAS